MPHDRMRAYLARLPRCEACGKPATVELRNPVNAPLGRYCDRHGKKALEGWTSVVGRPV